MTLTTAPTAPTLVLQPERPQDDPAVTRLLDRAFGPGRFTKVSERVREFAAFTPAYSFCAWEDGVLLGSVRLWRVQAGGVPLVFLGPLAVGSEHRKAGVGALLVEKACEAAQAAGESAVLLVGDEPYFRRLGFTAADARDIRLPGPVDPARVLLRPLNGAQAFAGPVRPIGGA